MNADRRRQLLRLAGARARAGTGSGQGLVREPRSRAYVAACAIPDLKGIRHAIVGGLATARYMPERMTLDTDVLIHANDLDGAEALLTAAGCRRLGALSVGGSTWRTPEGRPLDVLALAGEWVGEALGSVVPDENGTPFVSLPYLVLMKLESGRLQDLADIGRMLGSAPAEQLAAVRAVVSRHHPADAEDLESIVALGRLERNAAEA